MQTIIEKSAKKLNGYIMLFLILALSVFNIYWLVMMIRLELPAMLVVFIPLVIANFLSMSGFFIVQPDAGAPMLPKQVRPHSKTNCDWTRP